VVDRQDDDLTVREKADPPHGDRVEKPEAGSERQYFEASVIYWMNCHDALPR
jgi:hypothetical protein